MKLNISFKEFKKNHLRKKNQIIFIKKKCKNYSKIENLFKFILAEKNSFIFESVEKGKIRGRYTIIGLNPDKIWDIKGKNVTTFYNNKKKITKANPLLFLNNLINDFKIDMPKGLPSMSSMLVGYFSYDVIRYIEKIPDNCKDDLKIPDVRLSRPNNLIIYDNLKKTTFYIQNTFYDKKIKNYLDTYYSIKRKFENFLDYENIKLPDKLTLKKIIIKLSQIYLKKYF